MQHDEELIARIREELSEEVKFVHYATDSTAHSTETCSLSWHSTWNSLARKPTGSILKRAMGKARAMVLAALPREWPLTMSDAATPS